MTQEEKYRESLKEAFVVLDKLGGVTDSVTELKELVSLAVGDGENPGNDAQLKILLKIMGVK